MFVNDRKSSASIIIIILYCFFWHYSVSFTVLLRSHPDSLLLYSNVSYASIVCFIHMISGGQTWPIHAITKVRNHSGLRKFLNITMLNE